MLRGASMKKLPSKPQLPQRRNQRPRATRPPERASSLASLSPNRIGEIGNTPASVAGRMGANSPDRSGGKFWSLMPQSRYSPRTQTRGRGGQQRSTQSPSVQRRKRPPQREPQLSVQPVSHVVQIVVHVVSHG